MTFSEEPRDRSVPLASQRNTDGFENFVEDGFCFFTATKRRRESRTDDDAMRKHRHDESLDVVGNAVRTIFGERESLRSAEERQRSSWTDAKIQHLGTSRGRNDAHQVLNERIINSNTCDRLLQ